MSSFWGKLRYYNEQNQYLLLVYPKLQQLVNIDERFICCSIENDCWNWRGALGGSTKGFKYGTIRFNGVYCRVPRLVYQLINNTILPSNIDVCHTCDNTSCYNPDHLFQGTRAQNMQDCVRKGRHVSGYAIKRLSKSASAHFFYC